MSLHLTDGDGSMRFVNVDGFGLFVGPHDGGFRVCAITTSPVSGTTSRYAYTVFDAETEEEAAKSVASYLRSKLMDKLLADAEDLRKIGQARISSGPQAIQ